MATLPLSGYLDWLQRQTRPAYGQPGVKPFGVFSETSGEREDSPGETGQGSSPEASDQSTGGRISLAAALDDPTSAVNLTFAVMSTLAGPLGTAINVGKAAMNAHNQAALTQGLRGEQGARLSAQRISEARVGLPDPPDAPEGDPNDTTTSPPTESEGPNPNDTGLTGPTGTGVAGGAPPGPTGAIGEAAYHGGGVVQDRAPGREEPIVAEQGEFIVRRGPAAKYRSLLEAINQGDAREIQRQAGSLKEAMTR